MQRIDDRLVNALETLLLEKDYAAITVTDLTRQAGVSRMAFYRCFSSKEEVVGRFVEVAGQQVHERIKGLHARGTDYFEALFQALGAYDALIRAACKAHLGEVILEQIDRYMQRVVSAGQAAHLAAGAFYNLLIHWIAEGKQESPRELATLCSGLLY